MHTLYAALKANKITNLLAYAHVLYLKVFFVRTHILFGTSALTGQMVKQLLLRNIPSIPQFGGLENGSRALFSGALVIVAILVNSMYSKVVR